MIKVKLNRVVLETPYLIKIFEKTKKKKTKLFFPLQLFAINT